MSYKLTFDDVSAIRRRLERGWRFVEIAREMNLSVWTISKVANEFRFRADPLNEDELPVDDAPADYVAKSLRRCPGCGGMVYVWPCVACQIRAGEGQGPEVGDRRSEVRDRRSEVGLQKSAGGGVPSARVA